MSKITPQRILHVVHQYPPENLGGTELYTQQVATAQAAQGHHVSVFYPSMMSKETVVDVVDGVTVHRIGVGQQNRARIFLDSFWQKKLTLALTPLLAETDLVHIQHLMGLPLSIGEQLRAAGIPYVVTLHDYWYPCANAQLFTNYDSTVCTGPNASHHNCGRCTAVRGGLPDNALLAKAIAPMLRGRAKLIRPILQNAQAIIAPTPFVADIYRQLGFDLPQLTVIAHGIDFPATVEPLSKPADTFRVVYVGGIAPQKGIHVLVDAFSQLPDNGFELEIAGDMTALPDYAENLRLAAHHPKVNFIGRIPHAQVWRLLKSADLTAIPTLWYETSSLLLDESFAMQTPVVASNIGVVASKIRHNIDSVLVPPNDATALAKAILELRGIHEKYATLQSNIPSVQTLETHLNHLTAIYNANL